MGQAPRLDLGDKPFVHGVVADALSRLHPPRLIDKAALEELAKHNIAGG